jgi:uncharacterized NAD-dependent epimerase/dehydratase family protein
MGKNVYSLMCFPEERMDQIHRFRERGLHVVCPVVSREEFERIATNFDWAGDLEMPVIGVFGTGRSQGKFTVQLALRRELLALGYRLGQLGTEHQSALFGFDYTFPIGYAGRLSVDIPLDVYVVLLQSVLLGIQQEDPNLCIVGAQSMVIPHPATPKSPGYTIHPLAQLLGTRPDGFIVVVSEDDEDDYIQDTMNTLHALGGGTTLALAFSDRKKEAVSRLGRSFETHRPMDLEEIRQVSTRLEQRFGLPAMEVVSPAGAARMAAVVVEWLLTRWVR